MAIAYVLAAKISLIFTTLPGSVASVWLPLGLTLGLILLLGKKVLPGIAAGSLWIVSIDLPMREPSIGLSAFLLINLGCVIANIVQPLLAQFILDKCTLHEQYFTHIRGISCYILAATVSPMASASIGITFIMITRRMEWSQYGLSWLTWWMASTLAHLIFTPVILLGSDPQFWQRQYSPKTIGLTLAIWSCVSYLVFIQGYAIAYLLLLLLNWVVFQYGALVAHIFVSATAIFAICATAQGLGFFVLETQNHSLLFLQSFMGVFALASLILSAVVEERRLFRASLQMALGNSLKLVAARTKELRRSEALLRQTNEELRKLVNLDPLTQIANRRCFNQKLQEEWRRHYRAQEPLSLLLFDVDFFKRYNDFYGHQQGDECLQRIAQAMQKTLNRPGDLVARYGGEEFVVILPQTDYKGAAIVAKRIRRAVLDLAIPHAATGTSYATVTISIGGYSHIPQDQTDPWTFVEEADQMLYLAKQQGRNRVVIRDGEWTSAPKGDRLSDDARDPEF